MLLTGFMCESLIPFVRWCDKAFLQLNITKTEFMEIDFRRKASNPPTQTIIKQVCKKGQQCLYFLRKVKSLHVDRKTMSLIYKLGHEICPYIFNNFLVW